MQLTDVLRALPPAELKNLVTRLGIKIDPQKRLDPPAQIARILVALPDLRDPSRLPAQSAELLYRLAEAGGHMVLSALPAGVEPLMAKGIVFARGSKREVELVMPAAYLLQLRPWDGEDPRCLRALLSQSSVETQTAIASHYLGRPATPPVSLALELGWETLSDPAKLAAEVKRLSAAERRVLEAVMREGGEVDTEELLELEREPLRLRSASGATPSRRGIGFSLERRALLIPVHPNRHIMSSEVARILGADGDREREERRSQVRAFVLSQDHAPRRARFAQEPGPLALGMALCTREPGNEARPGIGTPKSLVQKLATRFGREPNHVGLLIALSRACGLWDASAMNVHAPPGSLTGAELSSVLYRAWRRGGAWDEARPDPEMLRVAAGERDPSPVGALRSLVVDALVELGENKWVPWDSLRGYLRADERIPGLSRLFRRWAERGGLAVPDPVDVARRIVLESLPALGIVDVGEDVETEDGETVFPEAFRLTPLGRALLADKKPAKSSEVSTFVDDQVLRLGGEARVGDVLTMGGLVEINVAAASLELVIAPHTLAKALAAGFEPDTLKQRIEAITPLPETLQRTIAQASVVVGRGTFVATAGFLWVDDASVRELLRTRKATADLFVDPSPPAGLLVQPAVDLERLTRRCRTVGIEILMDGSVVRARTIPPPATTPAPARKTRAKTCT